MRQTKKAMLIVASLLRDTLISLMHVLDLERKTKGNKS